MTTKAQYLVTEAPGAYIKQLGFIVPGQYFEAPAEGFTPSRKFRALNEPAAAQLKTLQETMLGKAADYKKKSESTALTASRRESYLDAAEHLEDEAKAMVLTVQGKPGAETKTDARVSLSAMDKESRGGKQSKRISDV